MFAHETNAYKEKRTDYESLNKARSQVRWRMFNNQAKKHIQDEEQIKEGTPSGSEEYAAPATPAPQGEVVGQRKASTAATKKTASMQHNNGAPCG